MDADQNEGVGRPAHAADRPRRCAISAQIKSRPRTADRHQRGQRNPPMRYGGSRLAISEHLEHDRDRRQDQRGQAEKVEPVALARRSAP